MPFNEVFFVILEVCDTNGKPLLIGRKFFDNIQKRRPETFKKTGRHRKAK